ncbi:MAG: hypothetical protein LBU32_10065 [Clostridiales bacterium]|nr:hypothetical protein [Clostridiales bacterium]
MQNGLEKSIFQVDRNILAELGAAMGAFSIAANSEAISLPGIEAIPCAAMGLAITTVVARCVGAQEYEQQKHYAAQMIQLAFA